MSLQYVTHPMKGARVFCEPRAKIPGSDQGDQAPFLWGSQETASGSTKMAFLGNRVGETREVRTENTEMCFHLNTKEFRLYPESTG